MIDDLRNRDGRTQSIYKNIKGVLYIVDPGYFVRNYSLLRMEYGNQKFTFPIWNVDIVACLDHALAL